MRTAPPVALPLFRSDGQARLLAHLFLTENSRQEPLAQLARAVGHDPGAVAREVSRLERAGIVRARRVGRQRFVEPNPMSPLYEPLRELLFRAFGPPKVIAGALEPIKGVEAAYIFGSWAARYLHHPGSPPNDIDVLVVGDASRRELGRAAREAGAALGIEVEIHQASAAEFERAESGFLQTIKRSPLIALFVEAFP